MIMCIQKLVSISIFGLKILKKICRNSVSNLRKMRIFNPNVDIVNDNV